MEALQGLHHHQSPRSSFHYYCPSITPSPSSPLFLSQSLSLQPSPSIRASSSPSPPPPSSESEPISPKLLNPIPKVSTFDQNLQHPEFKSPQILNPLPKVSPFDQNLQHPESKSPQILNPLPKVTSFDQNPQNPESGSLQFFNEVRSFASITAASVFLCLGFCHNRFTNKSIPSVSSIVSIRALGDENIKIEEFQGRNSDDIRTILHLKLNEKVPIVHSFMKTKTDNEAWQVLKAQVSSCSVELELVKVGFEEILEKKEHGCNQAYYDCVLEYLEMIDGCKSLLKGIKFAMDKCERENRDVKYHLRFFNKVAARVRVLEGDMVGALKHFQEVEKE
ncbi:hypothetical protein Lal_00033898 [Lupinus albus]|uniref:Uncharacterized protein n=1 Tax=Lupinus albus TaxID=3870 RepID=A0A6A4QXZ4_LUPAL|nr:hypothetical protein Lalb_Chr03g0039651 [Lupinus albus]KAF1895948.1 hypothetical protein Lal_00033898 [Lupinus albus]